MAAGVGPHGNIKEGRFDPVDTVAISSPSILDRIRTRQARVGVIGLGYVGLPLAVEFARAGFSVTGFDIDESKNARINEGSSHIPDVPDHELAEVVSNGKLRATAEVDYPATRRELVETLWGSYHASGEREWEGHAESEKEGAPQEELLALVTRGLRDQHGETGAHAGERYAGDHLDHRGQLRPQCDQLRAAAQREDLVDDGTPRQAEGRDRERQQDFRAVDFVSSSGTRGARVCLFVGVERQGIPHRVIRQ